MFALPCRKESKVSNYYSLLRVRRMSDFELEVGRDTLWRVFGVA
jgi:hypothetical protein